MACLWVRAPADKTLPGRGRASARTAHGTAAGSEQAARGYERRVLLMCEWER